MATKPLGPATDDAPSLRYRAMTLDDLDDVLDIERQSFLAPWTPDLFVNEFSNWRSRRAVVCKVDDGQILGYVIWWQILDEAHLMNIAVNPAFHRQGIARRLMDGMLKACRRAKMVRVTLEVRRGNIPALSLYERYGFRSVGLRKNYYVDEGEDAVLMDLVLT